jgi:molybdenum cofactor synthesis domain-containing protein
MRCAVELLSIGNELLLGNTVNTNAAWLAANITSLGGTVTRTTTVRDKLRDISQEVKEAVGRKPDFIITTGGIGPTFDDMTIKAIARAFHLRLKLDKTALKMVREHYARRFPQHRTSLTRPRLKMALIPSGSTPIPNPVGTAPGVQLLVRRTQIYCLPGVPKEAKAIFRGSLSAVIRSKAGRMVFVERWLRVQGVMESSMAPIIDQVMSQWPGIYLKSHPRGIEGGNRPHIKLHFSISASDSRRAEQILTDAINYTTVKLRRFNAKISQA